MKSSLIVSAILATAAIFGGCKNSMSGGGNNTTGSANIGIDASSNSIVAGETVTFVARSRDTYGRAAKIRWTSTAGRLTTEQDGRIARVKFDEPGTYTVRAILDLDGRETVSDMSEVRVRAIN